MSRYRELRTQILEYLGCRCAVCRYADVRGLQIDHVNGDGAEERRDYGTGTRYLRHILGDIDSGRYQILCATCNAVKRIARFKDRHFDLDVIEDLFPEGMTNDRCHPVHPDRRPDSAA